MLGDQAYGNNTKLRERLARGGRDYVLAVGPARPSSRPIPCSRSPKPRRARAGPEPPAARPRARGDRRAGRRARQPASAQTVSLPRGPDGEPMVSRFAFVRVIAGAPRQKARPAPPRGMADRRVARGQGCSRPTTGSPTCPPTPSPSASPAWPGCAGRSSSTTSSSRASSASTTTKAAAGSAFTTTPPWSPPPTAS